MFNEFVRRDNCSEIAAVSHLATVCIELGRSMSENDPDINMQNMDRIYTSLMLIHKKFNSDITVEKLADIEHLSVSHYRTIFKQQTGFSPLNYIIELRIKKACELIVQSDMAIKEIAEAVGYYDQLYFSRIFKARTGIVPTSYKIQTGLN